MNKYSKIFHHISASDMRNTRTRNLLEKKRQEDEIIEDKEYIQDVMKTLKSDWRSSFDEQMSTADVFSYASDAEPGVDLTVVDASLDASFGHDPAGVTDFGYPANGLMGGTVIRDSGTGTGENGGFNIGKHLAFTGDSYYNIRWAALRPVDSSAFDTFTITAIRGNDTNGGEDPDEAGEQLELFYRNKDMGQSAWRSINVDSNGKTLSDVEKIIIPTGSDSSGLQNWSLDIPAHARTPSTQFMLFQATSSGTEYDHYGITKISFRRNTPINVVVPLSDPKSISFVRVGSNEGDPKKRKKKLNDQLEASDKYTTKTLGDQFPGQGARIGGEDPFKSTTVISDKEIKASPIGSEEVKKQFGAAKLKSALGQGEPQKGDPQTKVTNIIKGGQKDKEATQVSVAQQEKISAEKKQVQYNKDAAKEVERVVKKDSKEIKKIVDSLPQEQVDKIIKAIPEKELNTLVKTLSKAAGLTFDAANPLSKIDKLIPDIVKGKIADAVINTIATVTQPIIKAKTASNTLNAYDDFLGKLAKNKNTEGSSYDNPINIEKQITKGDMAALQKTVNSKAFQDSINFLKTNLEKPVKKMTGEFKGKTNHDLTRESAQGTLNQLIKTTIHANFGLDNSLHNNVQVDLDHLLDTGKVRLTKQYTFKPGGSVETTEGTWYGKAIENVLGIPLDTLSTGKSAFGGAIAAKIGLGNAEQHGGAYKAPGMFMELEIPEGQLNAKQEIQPSAEEKKNTLSSMIGFGDEEEGKTAVTTSAGETLSDGEMKSLEKMGLTPDQIKRVMDAGGVNDLKDFAAGGVEAYEYRDVETQSDVDWSDPKMVDYYMNNVFGDKPVPHDDTLLKLMLAATRGGKVLDALTGVIKAVGNWWNEGKTFGPTGEEGWTWTKLADDDWLQRQMSSPGKGDWSPFRSLWVWAKDKGGMLSGPTPLTREFFRRLGPMGAQLLEKIKQIGFDENIKPAIEKMSNSDLLTRVNEIWSKDPEGVGKIYTPLVDKDPTYQKYDALSGEEDKIWTDYEQYGQDEYNLQWKLYRAEQEIGKAYYGVTSNWDDTVPGWENTDDNKGYSDSILGRGDAAQKALDEFKYQPWEYDGGTLSGGGSWDKKTQWDRSPYSYANYQKIEKAWSDSYPVEYEGQDLNASVKMSDAKDKSFVKLYNKVKSAFGIDPQTVSRGAKVPSPVNDVISQWNSMWSKYDSALKAWQNENAKLNAWNKKEIDRLQGEVDSLDKEAEDYRQTHMKPLWDAQRRAGELGKEIADIDLESTFDKIGREVLTQWEFAHLEDEWEDGNYKDEEFKIAATYGGKKDDWDKIIDALKRQTPFPSEKDLNDKLDPYSGDKGTSGRGDRGSIKDIEYKKKLKAYSIDEPIVATTSQSKKKRKRTQVAHYQPQGTMIKETTFSRIKKMRKKFDYEGKPSPDGFPDNEPPELDPKTGMHPNYGKNASRYKKLDPVSARSMPKTGDPETDAEVTKAAKKPK